MTLVNDELLGRIARFRLMPSRTSPTVPDGERRSTQPGAGMEFADHREYHAGDDLRHLDVHAYARLGRPYVKLFAADRGLDVAILVDASSSMAFGRPSKLRVAAQLATAFAFVGISGGDRVRLANFGGKDRLDWRPVVTSTRNLPKLVDGLDRPLKSDDEETDLVTVATNVNSMLGPSGLTIVISDWWTREPDIAAKAFGRSGRELVAIQLLAPEEEDPRLLVEGWARLTDAESGDMLDLSLEAEAHAAYLDELGSWREKLGTGIEEVGGRLFTMRTDRDVSEVLHGDLQRAGLLG